MTYGTVGCTQGQPAFEQLEPRLLLDGLAEQQAIELFNVSPALFAENQGQWPDETVRYVHDGAGASVAMTDAGVLFRLFREETDDGSDGLEWTGRPDPTAPEDLPGTEDGAVEGLQFSTSFVGANQAEPVGLDVAETYFNYHIGDEANWRTGVPAYQTVAYLDLYDGIDLHTWGRRDSLKYEFHVAPGADYREIQVSYEGIEGLSLGDDGSLVVDLGDSWGQVIDDAPYIYQVIAGRQVPVAGEFALFDDSTYGFAITGQWDVDQELIIDPNLAWSTYLGGANGDSGYSIAVDAAGSVLVMGQTDSSGWVSGGFDTTYDGGWGDAFVAKLSPGGKHLWSTYLGGADYDDGIGIAVDTGGNVLVTGLTESSGWVSGGFNTSYNGGADVFAGKLGPAGEHLWSTYLGGTDLDYGIGIAVDAAGSVLVTGYTTRNGDGDAFVAKLSPGGGHIWSKYLGGASWDSGNGIAVDAAGSVLVTGHTSSHGWVGGGFDATYNGGLEDAFAAKLSPAGQHLWSTYLGGAYADTGYSIAVDVDGNVLVSGRTGSSGWVSGGFDTTHNGDQDAFAAKLSPTGGHLWSTYLGGAGSDSGRGIAVDADGSVLVSGETWSSGWVSGGFDTSFNGGYCDAFVVRLSPAGGHLWSTYLGGADWDKGGGIAVDAGGNVLVTGYTQSSGWVSGGFDTSHNGGNDAFVAKILDGSLPDLSVVGTDIILTPEEPHQRVTATVHNLGGADAADVAILFRDLDTGQTVATETIASIGPWDSEEVSVLWSPGEPGARIDVYADPYDLIEEESNANNAAVATLGELAIERVKAQWDGNPDEFTFGRFVSGLSAWNTFEANVTVPQDLTVDYVEFTIDGLGSAVDDDAYGGWTAAFNMGTLPGDSTLTVVAYDTGGGASEPWTGTVHVVPFPSWLGTPDGGDRFSGGHYTLDRFFPEQLHLTHTIDPEWWIIGGAESDFRLGIELGVTAGLDARQDVPIKHEFVLKLKVLGYEVFGYATDPFKFEIVPGISLSFSGLADGDTLSPTGLAGSLSISDFKLHEGSTPELSYTAIVPVGLIPIPVTVALGMNYGVKLNGELLVGWDVDHGELALLEGTYIEPTVSAEPYLFGGVGIPGFNIGLEAGGELGLHYRAECDSVSGYHDHSYGTFRINFRAVATAGEKFVLGEWTVPAEPWSFGDVPTGGVLMAGGSDGVVPDILPWPNLTADGAGNVLLTRVVDLDADPGEIDPEIFYALRDAGGTWSALDAVATNDRIESDPDAAFDGLGGAVVSWVHNMIDPALVETVEWDVYLQTQEIYSSYWNGSSWSAPQAVTTDAKMDGGPEVAFHGGQGLMVWEHAGGTASSDLDGFEIHYAVWDDGTHTWGSPAALTADGEGDWAPTLAFGPSGEAMAVWVHDDDSDPTTATLYYATWNGSAWSIPAAIPASAGLGVREPRVAYTSNGDVLLGWVGDQPGAGPQLDARESYLYIATWDHSTGLWSAPEPITDEPGVIEGLDLSVSSSDQAMLAWHGWDGQNDLLATVRDLAGSAPWTPPARITSNEDGEWMVSTAFDSAGVPVTVWANENVTTIFGEGAEGVELELVPDLAVDGVELLAIYYVEGEEAQLMADVANVGWDDSAATTLQFYLGDPGGGGTPTGAPVDVVALAPGDSATLVSSGFTLPAGTNDYYAVVASVAGETELANNSDYATAESAPPDLTGPQVAAEMRPDGVVPAGTAVLTLTFDEPVRSVLEPDISLVESALGCIPPDHVHLSPDGMMATLIFEGGLPAAAAADTYTLRVLDSVMDLAGNVLDGDGVGGPGGDYSITFSVFLPGDANGDGAVDGGDYTLWADHYNQPGDWGEGDFSGDGFVDGGDYTLWADNYGSTGLAAGGATGGAAEALPVAAYDADEDTSAGAPADMLALSALPRGRSPAGLVPSLSGWADAGAGRGRGTRPVAELAGATLAAGADQEAEQLPEGSGGRKASELSLYARLGRKLPPLEAELNLLEEPDLTVLAAAI